MLAFQRLATRLQALAQLVQLAVDRPLAGRILFRAQLLRQSLGAGAGLSVGMQDCTVVGAENGKLEGGGGREA